MQHRDSATANLSSWIVSETRHSAWRQTMGWDRLLSTELVLQQIGFQFAWRRRATHPASTVLPADCSMSAVAGVSYDEDACCRRAQCATVDKPAQMQWEHRGEQCNGGVGFTIWRHFHTSKITRLQTGCSEVSQKPAWCGRDDDPRRSNELPRFVMTGDASVEHRRHQTEESCSSPVDNLHLGTCGLGHQRPSNKGSGFI